MHFNLIANNEGVSLEKIDLSQNSDVSNWHSAATNVGYATPGNINSQALQNTNISNNSFSVSCKVFSPNQDGHHDEVLLQYQLPKTGSTASIYVFNAAGDMVKQLANNHLLSTNGVYQWDGTTAKGEKAHNGYYIINTIILHADGNNEVANIPVVLWVE
jgi:flagellar hook assembly protein FlgD